MKNEFLNTPENYKPEGFPKTPYMMARQEWDNRIGATVIQAKNWRLAFFSSAITALVLLGLLTYHISQSKVIPVIVGLDRERGEPIVIGRAEEQIYEPQLQEIKYFLSNFITLVRSVPADSVLIKQNWLKAYEFLRPQAANALNDEANRDEKSPLKRIGQETLTVQPLSIIQVADGKSYQARWEETVYDSRGSVKERYIMNGIFTAEAEPPKDEKTLNVNPLGIFITNFQWNKEL